MVAQRLSTDTRRVVVRAPSYLDRFGTPIVPADLAEHRCLGVRLGNDRIYDWRFLGAEGAIKPYVERGDPQLVLTDWAKTGLWLHLYYSSRRQLPPGIRLLADLIRELRPLGL